MSHEIQTSHAKRGRSPSTVVANMDSYKRQMLNGSAASPIEATQGDDARLAILSVNLTGERVVSSLERTISPPRLRSRQAKADQPLHIAELAEQIRHATETDLRAMKDSITKYEGLEVGQTTELGAEVTEEVPVSSGSVDQLGQGEVGEGEVSSEIVPTQMTRSQDRQEDRPQFESPFKLTRIRDLPNTHNIDTISLNNLLGDPLLQECWLFDYLFDIDFVMQHFDPDIRDLVKVKVVHGSWRKDDGHRLRLLEAVERYPNVEQITAHMPEAFGTHHSKMMILFRRDDTAQVVIHTANMIAQDWTNLTQGVWLSDRLPLMPTHMMNTMGENQDDDAEGSAALGSGSKFKTDLLRYLSHYEARTKSLRARLQQHDFSSVRAALIASVPTRQRLVDIVNDDFAFGWPGLQHALSQISCPKLDESKGRPKTVIQVSSVATLTIRWMENFTHVLRTSLEISAARQGGRLSTIFAAPAFGKPQVQVIFPATGEVRTSLDGYAAGASIHMRTQSPAQQKQLAMLRPMLCRWGSHAALPIDSQETTVTDSGQGESSSDTQRDALRSEAAPHIKTYIRFRDSTCTDIQWALLTSANLSTQAWGALPTSDTVSKSRSSSSSSSADDSVRICSYEIGVLVWPALFRPAAIGGDGEGVPVVMKPVFGSDSFDEYEHGDVEGEVDRIVVPLRMPYSLPLRPYEAGDEAWCATMEHTIPDSKGQVT